MMLQSHFERFSKHLVMRPGSLERTCAEFFRRRQHEAHLTRRCGTGHPPTARDTASEGLKDGRDLDESTEIAELLLLTPSV